MKKNALLILLWIICLTACKRRESPEASIVAFLTDVKNPNLRFSELYDKHIDFENRAGINPFFQDMIENSLKEIAQYLNGEHVDPSQLKITRYDKADRSVQKLLLFNISKEKVYVVQGKNSFRRYILLNDQNDIKTWMTIKGDRVFLTF